MSFYSLARLLRSRWYGLAGVLWPDTVQEEIQLELACIDIELQRRHRRLLISFKKIEKIRHKVRRREELLKSLARRQPDADTEQRLQRGRQTLDRLRQRLLERERRYLELLTYFNRCKQERRAIREQLLSLSPDERRAIKEEESDSGYPF